MLLPLLASVSLHAPLLDEPTRACRPGDHAPAGVMDVQCPMDGGWIVGLTWMEMHDQGMRDGTHELSTADVIAQGYFMTPTSMSMSMLMLDAMYQVDDRLCVCASLPWIDNSMHMEMDTGETFTTSSQGVGDLQAGLTDIVWRSGEQRLTAGCYVSAPTGSIDERDDMPGAPDTKLEYPMQLGSGTWDLLPVLAWRNRMDSWTLGAQASGRVHLSHNDNDYALGDRGELSAWVAYDWSAPLSSSLRLQGERWANVRGADPELDTTMSPSNDARKQGGDRIDVALGMNWMPFSGNLAGSAVTLELGVPLTQDLDGPQLELDWFGSLGIKLSF